MKVCIDCDIAYNERKCPLCVAKEEIVELEKIIDELEKIIDEHDEA